MDCIKAKKLITPYLEKRLSRGELQDFLNHVRECENCHTELETWFMINRTVESFQKNEDVVYDMRGLLDERINGQLEQIRKGKLYRKLLTGILILIAVVLFFVAARYFSGTSLEFLKGLL